MMPCGSGSKRRPEPTLWRGAARRGERLYDAGLVDAGAVLDARRAALRSRDALCQAEGARWTAAVALRRAFSGSV